MQRVSAINFAKIHKLVFELSCSPNLITYRYTDRQNSVQLVADNQKSAK